MAESEEENQVKPFPLEAKVILTGLTKAEYNDKKGIVKSELQDGRQQVLVGKKFLGIKPSNMVYDIRPVESLSAQELKSIVAEMDASVNFSGMDMTDLRREVSKLEPNNMFELLAQANAKAAVEKQKAKEAEEASSHKGGRNHADQFANMPPAQLRQQARKMKAMSPDQIRRANPKLRHMTDEQIRQAADQMEQMADNPELMRMAADQFKNMTPEQVHRATQAQAQGAAPRSIADMTPEQLLQQAQMMRGMSKDQIRRLNPQLAAFSDEQIEQSIVQMEQMAANPSVLEMVRNQMKDMSPEDIAKMQSGNGMPMAQGMDASKMMENMSGKQLKEMMNTMKTNPEMVKHMLPAGMSEDQFRKAFSMFENMDEQQLESAVKMMQRAQKVTEPMRQVYEKVKPYCGGHLLKIVALVVLFYVLAFIYLKFFSGPSSVPQVEIPVPVMPIPAPIQVEEDQEF